METISNRIRTKDVTLDCDESPEGSKTVWTIQSLTEEVDEYLQDSLIEVTGDNVSHVRNAKVNRGILAFGVVGVKGFVVDGKEVKPTFIKDYSIDGEGCNKLTAEFIRNIPQIARLELVTKIMRLTRMSDEEKKPSTATIDS